MTTSVVVPPPAVTVVEPRVRLFTVTLVVAVTLAPTVGVVMVRVSVPELVIV